MAGIEQSLKVAIKLSHALCIIKGVKDGLEVQSHRYDLCAVVQDLEEAKTKIIGYLSKRERKEEES